MTEQQTQAMRLALEELEPEWMATMGVNHPYTKAITALRQALEHQHCRKEGRSNGEHVCDCKPGECLEQQPADEPVGQLQEDAFGRGQVMWFNKPADQSMLYTRPQPAAWVGLTAADRKEIERQSVYVEGAIRMTEAKLKEKNNG